jgi:UDP-N-acetylglucosamine 2-epimerase (non-hydrolysing)
VTLHRPSNVDLPEVLNGILHALGSISKDMPIYFPIHPRTQKNIDAFGLNNFIENTRIKLMPPKSYLDFLALWRNASLVLTDSGGLQEETTALGIPCFTIRENTERPVTIEEGTNTLVGTSAEKILEAYNQFKRGHKKNGNLPELWDGKTAERIVTIILNPLP